MQAALAILSRLAPSLPMGRQEKSGEKGVSSLLKELVKNQEKTMFYTVTVSPPSASAKDNKLKLSSGLKWQCACALSKSQSVMTRTNSNSQLYYTLTFLGESEDPNNDPANQNNAHSPVRLYIRS